MPPIGSPPHALSDILFPGTDGIGIDGGGGELGMSEPFLNEVEGDADGDGRHAKAMAEPLGGGPRPGEPGFFHDGVDLAPGGHPAPGPETDILTFAAFRLHFTNAMHQVKGLKEGRGDGDGAMDTGAALLKSLEDEDAGSEIDAIGGEGQGLREAAAGIGQGHAEGPGVAIPTLSGFQEEVALAGSEVFAGAIQSMELHAGRRGRRCRGLPRRKAGARTRGVRAGRGSQCGDVLSCLLSGRLRGGDRLAGHD